MSIKLHHGDCLEVLRAMPAASVDSVVTDPPYGLSFMSKKWDYDVPSVEIWSECLRVLKPGGHLLAFAGTRTQHRMAVRIEDAGFEIRDMIAWVYSTGFPKSHNLNGEWQGWGTALKPALEPITVARKPLPGTVADNVLAHGTGAMNVDGCRVATDELKGKIYNNKGDALSWGGTYGKGIAYGNEQGRWPANLIHDGSDEVVRLFPGEGDNSAARFFYCAKASKKDRNEGCEGLSAKATAFGNQAIAEMKRGNLEHDDGKSGMNKVKMRQNTHPTVKPTALMRYLCRLVTPPSGVVLDPFMGSGSTGKAAILEGFNFIGIEREAEYLEIATARIKAVSLPIFSD